MIQNILSLNTMPEPADIADALALAVGHSYMVGTAELRGTLR